MELDIEQTLELIGNGFTREGAAMAVAESHGEGQAYVEALLAHPDVIAAEDDPLRHFKIEVVVKCRTAAQAERVMNERLFHDEDYGFFYRLTWGTPTVMD